MNDYRNSEKLNYLDEKPPFDFYDSSEGMIPEDSKMSGACCCCCCCCPCEDEAAPD